ncbi:efflux RND transporter permease subunit [Nitratifractor salsuginis]|uniref:Acriflavin resistance protein n=1 Tax=Nitratifractor salsuginis (strain DSM 16511 / JCM 12458 / E9I37-1) TaxID=749222 RepID=E6WZQ1_NITSE|nr:efflux RND transporter permease subunit [Nitratifractor salsuginis]ADV46692.1 acriflavin resistance protein [Nitratifractor salsuginis DSM 16511]
MIRRLIAFALDRPVLNHILFLLVMVLALFAYQKIPKEIFPPADLEKISIRGGYPGTSADLLDKMAVQPIEDDLKSVENLGDIDTVIQNGTFSITADIKPGADKQLVLGDVKDVITTVKRDLPPDMDEPIAHVVIHRFPLLLIAISGDTDQARLLEAAKALKSYLSRYKALNNIDIRGDADHEVKIILDEKRLEVYGIPKSLFYQAIQGLASIYPAGTFKRRGNEFYLSTINGEKEAKKLADTILGVGEKRIRLGDVARVRFGLSTPGEISHFNGKANISLNLTKTKEGNAIALSRQIRKDLRTFAKRYPDLIFQVYTDTSIWIKNRINLVSSNIFFGLILVFLALFLSVNWKIAAVVALGIPTSFFIALIGAEMLGYSMNMLTMLGALIALGMLVDEAIVVAENIYRHLEMGKTPKQAALDGAVEMFPAVVTATMTTVFAFLPLLIMSGQLGVFMKVLPVMITILLLSSLFEAFYFLPLHAKELFSFGHRIDHHEPSPFWDRAALLYRRLLLRLLRHKKLSLLVMVSAILLGTWGMLRISKFQLFPAFDASQIYISGKVDVNSKLEETEKTMGRIEKALLKAFKESGDVSSITSIVGIRFNPDQSFESGENLFHIFLNLHERKPQNFFDKYINPWLSLEYDDSDMKRTHSAQEILKKAQQVLKPFKNLKVGSTTPVFEELTAFVPQAGIVGHDIEIGLSADKDKKAIAALRKLEKKLASIPGVLDIADNAKEGPQELKLRVNDYGQKLGFNEGNLVEALRGLFLEAEMDKMFDKKGLVRIRLEAKGKDRNFDIAHLRLNTPDGQHSVLLKEITDFVYKRSMLKIYKENGERVWTVTALTDKKRILPSEVMERITPILQKLRKEGIKVIVKGEEKENRQVKREMGEAAIIAIFLIFIALVWMFNSLVLPLITISVIPLSILGALIGSWLMGINLTMPGVMGMVGLAGVVVNDALIMLDFIRGSRDYDEMVVKAGMRLRPIFLTSLTTVLGLITLIFFASGQALIIQPMAVSLGYGIAWATVLNLIYVPLMYAVVYRVKE